MKKIGFDLGSSSIGWFLREEDRILKQGVITFKAGMSKGATGGYVSPTADRRTDRLQRNLIRSRKQRKVLMLQLLHDYGMVPLGQTEIDIWGKYRKGVKMKFPENIEFLKWLACDFTYNKNGKSYENPYELRVKAIDHKLTNHELGRALYHIAQRRGYKDIGEKDKETKTQIERRNEDGFQQALNNQRTVAEALNTKFLDNNERARNQYPYRHEYENELLLILEKQNFDISKSSNIDFNDDFVKRAYKFIIWQQPIKWDKGTIGKCQFEPKKRRCALSHPIFEISRAWQFINTIKFKTENSSFESLPQALREKLFLKKFLMKESSFKFEEVRRLLNKDLPKNIKFNYPLNKKTRKYETSISGMPFCCGIRKIFGDNGVEAISKIENYVADQMPKSLNGYNLYELWHIITEFDEENLQQFSTEKLHIENGERKRDGEMVEISPLVILQNKLSVGYGNLSLYVLRKIIPLLKYGYSYHDAILLAKLPDALGDDYSGKKDEVLKLLSKSNEIYNERKNIVSISNNLINIYKGKVDDWNEGVSNDVFGHKNFNYLLQESDVKDVKNASKMYFGSTVWDNIDTKDKIIEEVGLEYQEFFFDSKRSYRKLASLQELFEGQLLNANIKLTEKLYHHSKKINPYGKLLKDKKTGQEILPLAQINAIKNPMFNKALSVLRKLVNHLILNGDIEYDTEVVIELARELNDNNRRVAIERYQRERRDKRQKIREFLETFKAEKNQSINVEDKIATFELWDEQVFPKALSFEWKRINNKESEEVLKTKKAIERYELWLEQKGQCMYTGKMITISQLLNSSDIDIEHTIPRYLLPDNTRANKTVAYATYNRDTKGTEFPAFLKNYEKDIIRVGTAIKPRLDFWKEKRDGFKTLYEIRRKPKGTEDENAKNKRIQEKHYYKMHYDYWDDKVTRFKETDVSSSWARRQLTDTQMISKYARLLLKTYFQKVSVQKGEVTSDFRKMLGFQQKENKKDRSKHTHHAIDAAILTLIPSNSSRREKLLKRMYKWDDTGKGQYHFSPFKGFNANEIKNAIEENTLIVNYRKDRLLLQTFKKIRRNGKIQYVKDINGKNIIEQPLYSRGDTIRNSLYASSFLGKIKDVERYDDGQPKRLDDNSDWDYKTGDEEFIYVKREPIDKLTKKNLSDIMDPSIRNLIEEQWGNDKILDHQGNEIRGVRIKKNTGRKVKERINYKSKKQYKNAYYSESDSKPYAILVTNKKTNERKLIEGHSFQIAENYLKNNVFDIQNFIADKYDKYIDWDKKLLKVGQKVIYLQEDNEIDKIESTKFQINRIYEIDKLEEKYIWLNHHLNAADDSQIDAIVKENKDRLMRSYEIKLGLSEVSKDLSIEDLKKREKDFADRKFGLKYWKHYRMNRLIENVGKEKATEIKSELDKYITRPATIQIEGQTPLLVIGDSKNWNFLYEDVDFKIDITGQLNFEK